MRENMVKGTLKYLSVGAHQGIVSFQNDIESLGYLLAFPNRTQLQWDTNKIKKQVKNLDYQTMCNKIYKLKRSLDQHSQCWAKPIHKFLIASRNIGHLQRPNYSSLRDILK